MQRRQLLRTSGQALAAAAGAGALSACTIRRAETGRGSGLPQVRWRMATSWPVSLDTIYGGAETICEQVKAMSGGGFTIESSKCSTEVFAEVAKASLQFFDSSVEHSFWSK